jgi:hypothetical protein
VIRPSLARLLAARAAVRVVALAVGAGLAFLLLVLNYR